MIPRTASGLFVGANCARTATTARPSIRVKVKLTHRPRSTSVVTPSVRGSCGHPPSQAPPRAARGRLRNHGPARAGRVLAKGRNVGHGWLPWCDVRGAAGQSFTAPGGAMGARDDGPGPGRDHGRGAHRECFTEASGRRLASLGLSTRTAPLGKVKCGLTNPNT
jgi:hypothetical protein